MAKFERKSEVVEAFQTKGEQWIVPVGNGVYELVEDADFRERFTPKDNEAKAMIDGPSKAKKKGKKSEKEDEAEEGKTEEDKAEVKKDGDKDK